MTFPAIAWSPTCQFNTTFVISIGWEGCPCVNIGIRNTKSALTFLTEKTMFCDTIEYYHHDIDKLNRSPSCLA